MSILFYDVLLGTLSFRNSSMTAKASILALSGGVFINHPTTAEKYLKHRKVERITETNTKANQQDETRYQAYAVLECRGLENAYSSRNRIQKS